jgi:Tripartite tricarboxylate transporter family receptor
VRPEPSASAVTTAKRSEALPDIPTVADFVPGYEASNIRGVGLPKNTPVEIVDKLNREINAALVDPSIKARLADLGATVLASSPADFGKLVVDETEKWAKVIRAANIHNRSQSNGQVSQNNGKAVSSADWGEPGGRASDVRWRRIALARKELHNGLNKSEREATRGRSTKYGRGHLVPAFRGIGRIFS